jgi:hypothetical protein
MPIVEVEPVEKNVRSTSSRATVRPGSTLTVVCLPEAMPSSPVGVKLS